MTPTAPTAEAAIAVANALQDEFEAEAPQLTFGQWLLQRVFPDVVLDPFRERDFTGAQRTRDARSYLIGMLLSETLPIASAHSYLHECATAQD